ncbi:hypothetical protein J6590_055247 [Homalodisca vitripennis]|nr:hypothetical protein J6590_055247 [Homalodisca vitripennis]
MAICGVCKNTSSEETDVKCSGSCGYVFHIGCIKGEFEPKTRSKKEYRCKDCRSLSSQSSQKSTSSDAEILTKECLVKLLESFKLEVFKEMTSFRAEINELSTSVQFMSDKMDTSSLGVDVRDNGISTAHRVPSYRKDRDPAIIVQFTSRSKREDWITKYRQKKTLLANQINQRFPSQRVYINDHLTPENKQLLAKLKIKCREIGYTFAWCRDAKIFARKASGEPVRRITCLEDVERLQ